MNFKLLVLLALLYIGMSDGKIFDLGNYSIDTGSYTTPADVTVKPPYDAGYGSRGYSLLWSWGKGEVTNIGILENSKERVQLNLKNYSSVDVRRHMVMETAADDIAGIKSALTGVPSDVSTGAVNEIINKSTWVPVNKPYPGFLVAYPNMPVKFYSGAIDDYTYIDVWSTESDDMFGLILRGLRVIPKEKATEERLKAIQNVLQ